MIPRVLVADSIAPRGIEELSRDNSLDVVTKTGLSEKDLVDLVPDFIPVLGYADDAIVVVLALRSAIRRAGLVALERNWPGRPDGLSAVLRLAGMTEAQRRAQENR